MKYGLVGLFLGILLLAHLDLLAENLSYLLLGLLLLLVAYLILVKILFFSNLIPKNTTDINLGKKYGTASGIGSLVIGIILIILGLFYRKIITKIKQAAKP